MHDLGNDLTRKNLPCGCVVDTHRDFIGRVLGTIVVRPESCVKPEHVTGHVVIMPGREHAKPE